MRKRTSPLFGINQMLVSATGRKGSSPSKNHVKIGSLRKLTCEDFLEWRQFQANRLIFLHEMRAMLPVAYEHKLSVDKAAIVGVQVPAKAKFLFYFFFNCLFMI